MSLLSHTAFPPPSPTSRPRLFFTTTPTTVVSAEVYRYRRAINAHPSRLGRASSLIGIGGNRQCRNFAVAQGSIRGSAAQDSILHLLCPVKRRFYEFDSPAMGRGGVLYRASTTCTRESHPCAHLSKSFQGVGYGRLRRISLGRVCKKGQQKERGLPVVEHLVHKITLTALTVVGRIELHGNAVELRMVKHRLHAGAPRRVGPEGS